jgi:type III restriction enzyme
MNGAGTIRERAQGLRDAITVFTKQLPASPEEPEKKILEAAHGEYRTLLEEADTMLDGLTDRATAIANATGTPWQEWDAKLAAFKTQYDAAVTRSSAHSEKMAQLKRVEEELAQHGLETARIRDELATLASVEAVYLEERKAWEMLLADRAKLLEAQCNRLTESSANAIRARVKTHADAMDFVSSLRQALSGSRVPTSKVEALGQAIVDSANPAAQWSAVLSNLEKLAEFDPDSEASDQRPETPTLSAAGLSAADLDRIARALKPEHWIEISLTPIRSVPLFEYRAREGEYIPFKNASAGQQATALLKTLLSESGPPLIIDQPEEDLDNPVILEVVELVWNAKQRRQLLFTSHNANLVVNGDAELVAWCDYRTAGDQSGGTIAGEGAIDVPQVREAIKRIMEGGEAAFALRKEKYGF